MTKTLNITLDLARSKPFGQRLSASVARVSKFEALPGDGTKLISQSVFQSVAARDGMVRSGMEHGVNDGYERLDELIAKTQDGEKAKQQARTTSN